MSNAALWSQATHTLTLIGQQNPEPKHIKALHDGLLTDLVESIMQGALPDRRAYRRGLGLEMEVRMSGTLSVDNGQSYHDLIKAGNFTRFSSGIMARNKFSEEVEVFDYRLFYVNRDAVTKDVKRMVANTDKENPWSFADIQQLICFSIQHPDLIRNQPTCPTRRLRVVALGALTEGKFIPVLDGWSGELHIGEDFKEKSWPKKTCFLAVRKIKK